MTTPDRESSAQQHGDVFRRGWGSMFIHVQRETGLAHRNLVLRPWQVQVLRLIVSRWFAAVLTIAVLSWAYFAVQAARVPFLSQRITHLEDDAAKIDTLQATLEQLQRRYSQVQQMLSAATRPATTPAAAEKESASTAKVATPTKAAPSAKPAAAEGAHPATSPPTKAPRPTPPDPED
ncbi:MAG: hypothetical protein FJ363_13505 [Gemmatimonadetes bacterium]|nr:hypothetical protein [Gemmatimonadota bacterium]